MPHFIYSPEELPNTAMLGKSGYTPEWFIWNGVQLPVLNKGQWVKLPDNFYNTIHKDWRDRGTRTHIAMEDIARQINGGRYGARGVVCMDHEPTAAEKVAIEASSAEKNMAFRMTIVEGYENAVREREITGKGRSMPTPYEDECYTILGLTKPYSVEAMRAARHPGEAVGDQIVSALNRLLERREAERSSAKEPVRKGA
jgi:hypothetical protein